MARNVLIVSFHTNRPFSAWYQPRARKLVSVYVSAFTYISLNRCARTLYISIYIRVRILYYMRCPRIIGRAVDQWYKQGRKCKHDKADGKRARFSEQHTLYSEQSRSTLRIPHYTCIDQFRESMPQPCRTDNDLRGVGRFAISLHLYAYMYILQNL